MKNKTQDVDFNDRIFVPLRLLGLTIMDVKKLSNFLKRYSNVRDILRLFLLRAVSQAIVSKVYAFEESITKFKELGSHYGITITNDLAFIESVINYIEIAQAKNFDMCPLFKEIWIRAKEEGFPIYELEKTFFSLLKEHVQRYGLDRINDWELIAHDLNIPLDFVAAPQEIQALADLNYIKEASPASKEPIRVSNIISLY